MKAKEVREQLLHNTIWAGVSALVGALASLLGGFRVAQDWTWWLGWVAVVLGGLLLAVSLGFLARRLLQKPAVPPARPPIGTIGAGSDVPALSEGLVISNGPPTPAKED